MDERTKPATLQGLVAAVVERSDDLEQRDGDPVAVRASVIEAADLLCTSYGAGALDRAKLLEQRQSDPFFARLVRVEVERRLRAT
ncbi:hypothetical protein [Mesorhizobium sp. CAU 1741]|uniref:hypothetical protein n=1 Tax=Mesorhizobium sp. CAU 1741 TaxID=3140366 RepID=UPI00325BF559